jgi:AcrR family transcriptional regulator
MVAHVADEDPSARGGDVPVPAGGPVLDDALLDAARRVLERHGVARATLERVAAESGLSRVTLYRRGITREVVLAALAERALDDYRRALWPALTGRGTGAERLRRALGALCDAAETNIELLLALGERMGAGVGAARSATHGTARRAFAEPLERLLRDGAADGSLRAVDARETAIVLLNLAGWTYVHLRAGERWSARRARRATLGIALRGVAAEAAPGRGET